MGAQLVLGNITVYFSSYYWHVLGYDVYDDTFYVIGPMIMIFSCVGFPLANLAIDYCGGQSRPVIAMAALIFFVCYYLCYSQELSPGVFILLYGVTGGLYKGFVIPSILRAGWSHLPLRKGLATGIMLSATGVSGFLYGYVFNTLCNPDGL